mmetsp:Transcript_50662/g.120941  ORF Transcript_50662/g.120941 Transcript_50662/m.120941 type:complete len:551 (-) Transcript_50662:227-1879(-)
MQQALTELVNFGFSEARAREALSNIGDVTDTQLAINWLLDHGEEDKGGAVQFKHCPHIAEFEPGQLLRKGSLTFGKPCQAGCKGTENWVCLMCGETNCGRYMHRHALQHWQQTKAEQEKSLTVGEAAAGVQRRGHCLCIGLMDLSVWCYECESYVQHEVLQPIVAQMQRLKFGEPVDTTPEPAPGSPMPATNAKVAHGFLGDPSWPMPSLVRACSEDARPGYKTMKAHEYMDQPEVLRAKVKLLADLIRRSQHCVAYTGAGISTASGIRDYATKASGSVASAASKSPWCAAPTLAHHTLVALHSTGYLKHWVQQNHDGLPQKAGYPQKHINEIHGAWWDPSNPVVPMDGTLRGDLIEWMLEWEEKADLCLALGTSMVGMNSDRMALAPAQRAQRQPKAAALGTVICALQQTQYDQVSSLRIFAPLDELMRLLAEEMSLEVAQTPWRAQRWTEPVEVPYDANGRLSATQKLRLDLRPGSRLRLVRQPGWDKERHGEICQVVEAPEVLAEAGHVELLFDGDGFKKKTTRFLGGWWIEAAIRGEVASIPVVPA